MRSKDTSQSAKVSRRNLLQGIGVAGMTGLAAAQSANAQSEKGALSESELEKMLAEPSRTLLSEHEDHLVQLTGPDIVVTLDKRYGSIHAITLKSDPMQTNYIGNEQNTPGVDPSDSLWTGDIVTTVWELLSNWRATNLGENAIFHSSGKWQRESTGRSADIRRVGQQNGAFVVEYDSASANEEGIRSYHLTLAYRIAPDGSLLWDITFENTTNNVLEIGELGIPLMVNDDYAELYIQPGLRQAISTVNNVDFSRTPLRQKLIYEQKVLTHPSIAGHSSYLLVQRPLGDSPYLLVHPTGDTSFECIYKDSHSPFAAHVKAWRGPDILAIHSWATQEERHWLKNPWVNGHTSLLLQPGEKKSYQLRFAFISSYEAIRSELAKAGNLGIRVLPSMVVQEATDVLVEIQSQQDIGKIDKLSDNITIKGRKRQNHKTLLTLSFKGRGQKGLKLNYGDGKWTNLHFYCIDDIECLLKARAQFIVERQFYKNPEDPYHRYHMFLPFDYRIGSTFLTSNTVWEVGGSDDAGFADPLFLAEKNVDFPDKKEVETLEAYVTDCLFKYIQNPETYAVRASLYYKVRKPSSLWGDWSKKRSEATFRTYNYVHPAVIYDALYRIGKRYGLTRQKTPDQYLRMSYRTCMKWFVTGPWRHVGLMEGSHSIRILEHLKAEGWQEEYNNLRKEMQACEAEFVRNPYPYSSELLIDQTAQEQVYFFTRYFGDTAKNRKTFQVLKAMRGGNQPCWFRYGNDKRDDVCCWYTASLNGKALLQGFEDSGDQDALINGYAGVVSVMENVLPGGMGFDLFRCTAGIFDHDPPRTFEGGIGLWGFLRAAKSYVVKDPTFGLVGYGCRLESSGQSVTAFPRDGVRKRVRFVEENIDIEATQGEIQRIALNGSDHSLDIIMGDSTGLVKASAIMVQGLQKGEYRLSYGRSMHNVSSDGTVKITAPITDTHIRLERA